MNLRRSMMLIPMAAAIASSSAMAANLCVSHSHGMGCYTSISDAVSAASPGDVIFVDRGTYKEGVVITEPLSLVGNNATIDATGMLQGILVNGLATSGLANVHISGFRVENANNEGVLLLNVSYATLSGNTVMNNDRSFIGGSCTDEPSYETGELMDCGEGIHLQAVDHSVVTHNVSEANSGGILLSDDTGATHDNLISENTVQRNPYDCGITLASHVPVPGLPAGTMLGVFHNTVYHNTSNYNGLVSGGGAGLGLFASAPGTMTYANVVVGNTARGNGLPGVAMHAHAPHQMLSDNMIVGNELVGNGPDDGDAATPGPAGINLFSASPLTNAAGNIIAENTVRQEAYDVVTNEPQTVGVWFNDLQGPGTGLDNLSTMGMVDATNNWWGCPLGPTHNGCSSVMGTNVWFTPWLTPPLWTAEDNH